NVSSVTASFQAISTGQVQAGHHLNFIYRLGNFTPEPYHPPAAGSGNFIVSVSTDHGITYSDVETVVNNGVAGWQDYELDLSAYVGQYVRVKITANRISGDYFIGFDNFYIGSPITCPVAEELNLEFVSDEQAQIAWDAVTDAEDYNWFLFNSGADPLDDTPLMSGNISANTITLSGLSANTEYDFYLQTDCGSDGLSSFSSVLSFTTGCAGISAFPFGETFENDSPSRDCWRIEYTSGTTDWVISSGAAGGSVTAARSGELNALFYFASYAVHKSKLVSPSLDLSGLTSPTLSFW